MRIGLDPKLDYYFRAVCAHCDATKSGTCKPSTVRKSSSQKNRGQGRPGGACWAWALHAESLPLPHDRSAHASCDQSFPKRKAARLNLEAHKDFDMSVRCLERSPSPGNKPRADDPGSNEPWELPLR